MKKIPSKSMSKVSFKIPEPQPEVSVKVPMIVSLNRYQLIYMINEFFADREIEKIPSDAKISVSIKDTGEYCKGDRVDISNDQPLDIRWEK